MIQGIVFDIDDTLFLERDYVRSGFAAVARAVGRSEAEIEVVRTWLDAAFDGGIRGDTFDRLRDALPWVGERATTAGLVDVYRTHPPAIHLMSGFEEVLDRLRSRDIRLGALSDGPLASQAGKAAALELTRWLDPIILTAAQGPTFVKPGTDGFQAIAMAWDAAPGELAYVADNPAKDFAGPRVLGWTAVRLRCDGQLRALQEPPSEAFAPHVEIARPEDLLGWLDG